MSEDAVSFQEEDDKNSLDITSQDDILNDNVKEQENSLDTKEQDKILLDPLSIIDNVKKEENNLDITSKDDILQDPLSIIVNVKEEISPEMLDSKEQDDTLQDPLSIKAYVKMEEISRETNSLDGILKDPLGNKYNSIIWQCDLGSSILPFLFCLCPFKCYQRGWSPS